MNRLQRLHGKEWILSCESSERENERWGHLPCVQQFIQACVSLYNKLSSITTDGAPPMVGKTNQLLSLCKKDKRIISSIYNVSLHNPPRSAFNHVIEPVTKMVNLIRATPIQHTVQKNFGRWRSRILRFNIIQEIRWLSKGNMLERFVNLFDDVKAFLRFKSKLVDLLNDNNWWTDLWLIANVMLKLSELNLEL